MENNKYYTPSIEEFHVGFEYEFKHPDYEAWNKYTTPEFQMEREDCIPFVGNLNNFRVKYLDGQDIADCGWKFGIINIGNNQLDVYGIGKHVITTPLDAYDRNKIIDISYVSPMKKGDISRVFRGVIKNKSELKRLMKQLGIYE